MTLKEHKKHTSLIKPLTGNYGRNEWAIVGGQCNDIKMLAGQVIQALSAKYKCAYVDASHDDAAGLPGTLANGAAIEYTAHVGYQQLNLKGELTPFQLKEQFTQTDLVLLNGNHQQAKAQVVIIDGSKQASLQKRVAQLNNVQLFLLADGAVNVFNDIKEAIPHWEQIPVYHLEEVSKIVQFFDDELKGSRPILKGLVLAGGKSLRMGVDKASLNWHGKEQRLHMADMLRPLCAEVFISTATPMQNTGHEYPFLADTFTDLGPFGAILSAFRANPNRAWLVVACDLPMLDVSTLQHLVDNRHPLAIATAFDNRYDGLPEPLITIWEPKSYPVLLSFLAQGYSCPRKVLINSDTTLLKAPNAIALTNVNTPEEMEKVKAIIQQKTTLA